MALIHGTYLPLSHVSLATVPPVQLALVRRSQGPSGEDSPGHGGSGDGGGGAASEEEGAPLALPPPEDEVPQQQQQQEVEQISARRCICCTFTLKQHSPRFASQHCCSPTLCTCV